MSERVREEPDHSHSEVDRGKTSEEVGGRRTKILDLGADYGVVVFLAIMIIAFSIAAPDSFPTTANLRAILGAQAVPGIVALAVLIPLMAGEFDLSVGATLGFCAVFTAWALTTGVPLPIAILLAVIIGLVIGLINGFFIVVVGVHSLIATLGMATILGGGNLLITQGSVLFRGIPSAILNISRYQVFTIPLVTFYFFILAFLLWYLLEKTPFGRYVRSTGLGREAARLAGVRTDRYRMIALLFSASLSSVAGVLQVGRLGAVNPTIGPEFLLGAFAAVFLGSTTVLRGRFNVWGTVVAVFVLAVGISGLGLIGAPFWVAPMFNGAALIGAVTVAIIVGRGESSLKELAA